MRNGLVPTSVLEIPLRDGGERETDLDEPCNQVFAPPYNPSLPPHYRTDVAGGSEAFLRNFVGFCCGCRCWPLFPHFNTCSLIPTCFWNHVHHLSCCQPNEHGYSWRGPRIRTSADIFNRRTGCPSRWARCRFRLRTELHLSDSRGIYFTRPDFVHEVPWFRTCFVLLSPPLRVMHFGTFLKKSQRLKALDESNPEYTRGK